MPLHYPLYTPYLGVPPFLYYPPLVCGSPGLAGREDGGTADAVSYTHLTLPTSDGV